MWTLGIHGAPRRPSWPGPLSSCWTGWAYARYRRRVAFIEARVGTGASISWQSPPRASSWSVRC
eukprot:5779352-Lingulodinium_polyedra.AAC.1